eukprot:UN24931
MATASPNSKKSTDSALGQGLRTEDSKNRDRSVSARPPTRDQVVTKEELTQIPDGSTEIKKTLSKTARMHPQEMNKTIMNTVVQDSEHDPYTRERQSTVMRRGLQNNTRKVYELLDHVKIQPLLQEWTRFGDSMKNVRKALKKIAAAQKVFGKTIKDVIQTHSLSMNSSGSELFGTWAQLFTLIKTTAVAQENIAIYITTKLIPQNDELTKNDKQMKLNWNKSISHIEKRLQTSKDAMGQSKVKYDNLLKLSKEMADPRYQPTKKKEGFFHIGKKKQEVPIQEQIGEVYNSLQTSENQYTKSVDRGNELQEEYTDTLNRVKQEVCQAQKRRLSYSIEHLKRLRTFYGHVVDGKDSKQQLTMFSDQVNKLDKDVLLKSQYGRLVDAKGEEEKLEKLVYQNENWKNIFVSLEEAMEKDHPGFPKILSVLCNKIKEKKGFSTQGVFRVAAEQTEKA